MASATDRTTTRPNVGKALDLFSCSIFGFSTVFLFVLVRIEYKRNGSINPALLVLFVSTFLLSLLLACIVSEYISPERFPARALMIFSKAVAIIQRRDDSQDRISGANAREVTMFGAMLAVIFLVNLGCFALRSYTLKLWRMQRSAMTFARVNLIAIYIFACCFVVSCIVTAYGWHMNTFAECSAGIYLCLVFYLGGKVLLYLFLVERIRCINQVTVDRCADLVWQRFTYLVLAGFGQIALICFFYPVMSTSEGHCNIGLPTFITIPMLLFDVLVNISVSITFYCMSRREFLGLGDAIIAPSVRRFFYARPVREPGTFGITWRRIEDMPEVTKNNATMAGIIRRTIVVSVFILFSTIANLVLLYHYHGEEHGWLCFLTCSFDITWNVTCVTYLIATPTKDES